MNSIRGRLRAPIAMLASGAVLAVVGGIGQGWGAAIAVMAVTIAAAVVLRSVPMSPPASVFT